MSAPAAQAITIPAGGAADVLARQRTLPAGPLLAGVLDALQRGSTVACGGDAPLLALCAALAGPSQAGAWTALAGQPTFSVAAAAQLGVDTTRLIAVHAQDPGHDTVGFDPGQDTLGAPSSVSSKVAATPWADVLAAMIDGFDLVVAGVQTSTIHPTTARRLHARAQRRGAVLFTIGEHASLHPDITVRATTTAWHGLAHGDGCALHRELEVEVGGRRMPRPRRQRILWPDAERDG